MRDAPTRAVVISTHAPRTGSDASAQCPAQPAKHFNPRSPHGERPHRNHAGACIRAISTHAPRTGSDAAEYPAARAAAISTHAPRTGSDKADKDGVQGLNIFQPTLPARGATEKLTAEQEEFNNFNPRSPHGERHRPTTTASAGIYFNPRSPHGERRNYLRRGRRYRLISTHAPRTGSDNIGKIDIIREITFQPTLPARGATVCLAIRLQAGRHFNPRSPHGERHKAP